MQLGLDIGQLAKRHGGMARLEEDFAAIIAVVFVAVEDVFEVEAGHGGHKQVGGFGAVGEGPDAVVASAVASGGGIVADDGGKAARLRDSWLLPFAYAVSLAGFLATYYTAHAVLFGTAIL